MHMHTHKHKDAKTQTHIHTHTRARGHTQYTLTHTHTRARTRAHTHLLTTQTVMITAGDTQWIYVVQLTVRASVVCGLLGVRDPTLVRRLICAHPHQSRATKLAFLTAPL